MKKTTLAGIGLTALLAITGCGGEDDDAANHGQEDATEASDAFEDIPEDAPIHGMDEDDLLRHMLDCEDSETTEDCEKRYENEVEDSFLAYDIESCQEAIEEYDNSGISWMPCRSATMPNSEFYAAFEDRTGASVPDALRASDEQEDEREGTTEADGDAPETGGVDFSQVSSPDDLYVDIHTLNSCEDADTIWGGLMNAEIEGHEIDGQYLADLEDWLVRSVCW